MLAGTRRRIYLEGQGERKIYDKEEFLEQTQKGTFKDRYLKGEIIFYNKNGKIEQTQKGTFNKYNLIKGKILSYDTNKNLTDTEFRGKDFEKQENKIRDFLKICKKSNVEITSDYLGKKFPNINLEQVLHSLESKGIISYKNEKIFFRR